MNQKFLSIILALSMISSLSYAAETNEDALTPSDNINDELSQVTDITQEYSGIEAVPEEFVEETGEILPLEYEEPDPSKTDRFIVKYKKANLNLTNSRLTDSIKKMKSVSSVTDIESSAASGFAFAKSGEKIKAIVLRENVDIEDFANEIMSINSAAIEYIQPDYKVDLSAYEGDEYSPEVINDIAAESESAVSASNAEAKEVQMNNASNETEALEIEDMALLSDISAIESDNAVIVALIDTGVDITNSVLSSHIYENELDNNVDGDNNGYLGDVNGWDFYNDGPNVYSPDLGLEQAHGTHIAGVIAETAPNAKILPLKVFENGTAYTSDIIEAIEYADSMGADIVNCSWGCTDENRALKEAMEQTDMTFVCAVGNNRLDLTETPIYPVCYDLDNIVSVTSVNADGGLSYFSNYNHVDIAALGRDVEGIFPGGETGVLSGTSISAGYVSGALASIYTDAAESIARLYDTSDKLLNLQNVVTEGRRLNLSNLRDNISSHEVIDVNPAEDFNTEGYNRTPAQSWELFSQLDNVSVQAGLEFIAVLKADGSVWTWGKNNYGQLGNGTFTNTTVPQQVPNLTGIEQISAGTYHMMAVNSSGQAYAWGYNGDGGLGNGTRTNSAVPVAMLNAGDTSAVYGGEKVSFVINNDGELYVCGQNYSGEQCDSTGAVQTVLHRVPISEPVIKAAGEYGSCMAVTSDGKLYTWASNAYGKLGDGTTENKYTPQMVIDSNVVDADIGFWNTIAVLEDGSVYFCGYGATSTMTKINGISGSGKVAAGRQEEFVMQENIIKARGTNYNGSLGVGDTSWHSSWMEVTGSFIDFDICEYWGAAIGTNGCVYTWGIIDADTGEYVTAPEKLSSTINDLAADEMDYATTTTTGETKGNLISMDDVDYYKFTPSSTGIYSVYSISQIDLVCKIYTRNNDGTYTLKFSNDDGNGIMGGGSHDFYISKPMTSGIAYYIYIYPYNADYEGEYSLYIRRESNASSLGFTNTAGTEKNIYVNVNNISTFTNRTITVTYDPSKLELIDGCIFNPKKNVTVGAVDGTNVNIVSISAGEITFKVTYTIPGGKKISGPVNVLRFKALTGGYKTVSYKVNDLS